LFRHFPTREALFEALLRTNLDALTQKAGELETSNPPDQALVSWFREGVAFVHSYSRVVALMASAHEDPDSALYAPCTAVHEAGARLLLRAQAEGTARADMDADHLFALMSALGWLFDQPLARVAVILLLQTSTSGVSGLARGRGGADRAEVRDSDRAERDRSVWSKRKRSGTWSQITPHSTRSLNVTHVSTLRAFGCAFAANDRLDTVRQAGAPCGFGRGRRSASTAYPSRRWPPASISRRVFSNSVERSSSSGRAVRYSRTSSLFGKAPVA